MKEKTKGLLVNLVLYVASFLLALPAYYYAEDMLYASFLFTMVATLVIFVVTCFYPDTSLYDPYWSVAPVVMVVLNMFRYHLWNINAWIVLLLVLLWGTRLTFNWAVTYHGLGHEDWRYAQFREKLPPIGFFFINMVGLQYVPTLVVYAALAAGFLAMQMETFVMLSVPGIILMLMAVAMEFFADTEVHAFLRSGETRGRTCDTGVWQYSRHPNYFGEILFWTGLAVFALPLCHEQWYYLTGFLLIALLFNVVSIPMMERHNLQRRPDYAAYQAVTPRLFPRPRKKQ